jgi:signal transduction histidine kinase
VNPGVRSGPQLLAEALLPYVERIAERSVARMQELLPAYSKVPRDELIPGVQANTRNLLEAIRDPDTDRRDDEDSYRASGESRARQGITSDEMLNAWRIGLEGVREEANAVAAELRFGTDVLLEFVVATLQWGDVGMRTSALAHHEAEIRELGRLVQEQAALRRVATIVAHEASAEEVFAKVAEEVALLLGVEFAAIHRYEPDGDATAVGLSGNVGDAVRVGDRMGLEGDGTTAVVHRTERPVRIEDYEQSGNWRRTRALKLGMRSGVGTPIFVSGRLWGAIVAATSRAEPLPADAESRIANFTELVATAISNIQARSDLAASRARVIAASDKTRRQIERDLHDGAQQRLVHTVINLKFLRDAVRTEPEAVPGLVAEALEQAEQATVELRELVHGILPPTLTHGGLSAAVKTLGSRVPVPVELDVDVGRLPDTVEATAYFLVAEALTNVAKHSRASHAAVSARLENRTLQVEVRDDGVGGARADGTGLVGLSDRLGALDATLRLESPAGGGTRVAASIPLR